jgi:hypothetical protein
MLSGDIFQMNLSLIARVPFGLPLAIGIGSSRKTVRTCALQVDCFRVAGCIPERKDVDRAAVLVDGVNDPILGSATDAEEIGADVSCAYTSKPSADVYREAAAIL